tara:strand:- start:280 stop:678 length:399 start_codon:yes stop_codon:yes gene_type:complete
MQAIKKTATRVKFDGMTFLHYDKCAEGNYEPKEYLVLNGITYYKIKNTKTLETIPDENEVEVTIDLPTVAEIKAIEKNKRFVITEQGSLQEETKQPIIYDPKHPGKKTKATYLNAKTGNYVSYVRAIQLRLV